MKSGPCLKGWTVSPRLRNPARTAPVTVVFPAPLWLAAMSTPGIVASASQPGKPVSRRRGVDRLESQGRGPPSRCRVVCRILSKNHLAAAICVRHPDVAGLLAARLSRRITVTLPDLDSKAVDSRAIGGSAPLTVDHAGETIDPRGQPRSPRRCAIHAELRRVLIGRPFISRGSPRQPPRPGKPGAEPPVP